MTASSIDPAAHPSRGRQRWCPGYSRAVVLGSVSLAGSGSERPTSVQAHHHNERITRWDHPHGSIAGPRPPKAGCSVSSRLDTGRGRPIPVSTPAGPCWAGQPSELPQTHT